MNLESIRTYCLSKAHTREGLPFDEHTLVFYVADKMFALIPLKSEDTRMNLKCDPERSILLREEYDAILPGFHMNKKHWNTLIVSDLHDVLLRELIDHSYDLVLRALPKKRKAELGIEN